MKITALAPWFGSNRNLAENVGTALAGCGWVGVPFGGGMCEIAHIKASSIVVSDLHKHIINLALCVKGDERKELINRLDAAPFHPDTLMAAQNFCRAVEDQDRTGELFVEQKSLVTFGSVDWAYAYHICCWMGRSAVAGTDGEFKGGLPVRWSASGGDSNTRFRSAVESLDAWGAIMKRCNFVCQDVFDFLENVKDIEGNGLYLDPPFPGPGDSYKHTFTAADHRRMAARLAKFRLCRVVCRFYDHPLIRELYPESRWAWNALKGGRKQTNEDAPEVLLANWRAK